MIFQRLAQVL